MNFLKNLAIKLSPYITQAVLTLLVLVTMVLWHKWELHKQYNKGFTAGVQSEHAKNVKAIEDVRASYKESLLAQTERLDTALASLDVTLTQLEKQRKQKPFVVYKKDGTPLECGSTVVENYLGEDFANEWNASVRALAVK